MEQEAVATETGDEPHEGAVGDVELVGNLSQGGAAQDSEEEGLEQLRLSEPVGGGEGL